MDDFCPWAPWAPLFPYDAKRNMEHRFRQRHTVSKSHKMSQKNNTKHEGRLFNPKVVKISLLSSSEFWGWKCRWDSLDDVQRLWKVIQWCLGMSRFCLESKLAECSVIFQQFLTKGREENLVVWHVCSVLSILCQRLWHIRTSQVTGLMSQS